MKIFLKMDKQIIFIRIKKGITKKVDLAFTHVKLLVICKLKNHVSWHVRSCDKFHDNDNLCIGYILILQSLNF